MKKDDKQYLYMIAALVTFVAAGYEFLSFFLNISRPEHLLRGILFFLMYLALCYGYKNTE